MNFISYIMFAVGIGLLIIPFILTVFNLINLFKKKKTKPFLLDILTFGLGIILTILIYWMSGFKDYQEQLVITQLDTQEHAPIASWSMPTILTILIIGIISYIVVRNKKLDLPPLVIILSMSGMFLASITSILWIIQISKNISNSWNMYYIIFPLNYIICSLNASIEVIRYYKNKNIEIKHYNNKFLDKCNQIINDINKWPILVIIFCIPLALIIIGILVLFGQRPDEYIRAFTETSDWTLSKMYSPPPIEKDAHYLCTVSLRGHRKLVKPIRYGIRRGEKIIVNRQLCIANAFEQLIQEKTPRLHHFIRHIYDKYGYPISKYINTAITADIVYIIMKPLEYIFLFILYLFDKKPENRIASQYMPINMEKRGEI